MNNVELIQREIDARANLETEARAILVAAEGNDPSPEDQERFDKLVAAAEIKKARIDSLAKMETDAQKVNELRAGFEVTTASGEPPKNADEPSGSTRALMANIAETRSSKSEVDNYWEASVDEMRSAFETRAIADFSDSNSLYVSDFLGRLVVYLRTTSPWLQIASVVTGDGRPLIVPNLTADPTVVAPGEGTAITENSGTLGTVTATPTSYKTLSYISFESSQDEQVGLLNAIAATQGRSLGIFAGTAMSATILTGAGNGGTATGSPFFTGPDLVGLYYSVPPAARAVGSWVMSNGALLKTRKLTDTNGQFLWGFGLIAGQPDTLLGRPVFEDPGLATPASATKSVIFGAGDVVFIKQAPLRVASSVDVRFANDQIAIKSVYRAGAAVADNASIKYLVSAAV